MVEALAYIVSVISAIWYLAEKIGNLDKKIDVHHAEMKLSVERNMTEAKDFASEKIGKAHDRIDYIESKLNDVL